MTGWITFVLYALCAVLVGRYTIRRVYIAEQRRWPTIAQQNRGEDFLMAVIVGVFAGALWPITVAWLLLLRLARRAVPEYVSAELDDRIREQRAELDQLHRQMRIPPVDWERHR